MHANGFAMDGMGFHAEMSTLEELMCFAAIMAKTVSSGYRFEMTMTISFTPP